MRQPSALFFDLDDTLLDDDTSSRRCMELTCAEFASITPDFDQAAVARSFYNVAQAFWRHRGTGLYSELEIRTRLWGEALELHGISIPGAAAEFAQVYARERARVVMPYEEAIPVLDALRGRYRMAILTNGQGEVQRDKLAIAGMDGYFDFVVASTDIGAGKPDRLIFQTALEALNADRAATWHIGDNLATDVGGAVSAGLGAIWLNRYAFRPEAHHPPAGAEIANLRELLPLLGLA